jgi:hypothetical protein
MAGIAGMKDVYQVLREKELDVMRVRKEIEALRFAVPLLTEEADSTNISAAASQLPSERINMWPLRVETTLQDAPSRTSFPAVGGERSLQH